MNMRIVIHCGLPKTGTTAIQDWLADHPKLLTSKGILYPTEFPSPSERFHRFLSTELRTQSGMVQTRRVITQARHDGVKTLIFSIEGITAHLDKIRDDMAKELREIIGDDPVELVVCVRPYKSWATSLYRQCVITVPQNMVDPSNLERQYGCTLTLDEFLARSEIQKIADKDSIHIRMKELFPAASITFVDHGPQLVETFLSIVHVSISELEVNEQLRNTAIPDVYIEILMKLNSCSSSPMVQRYARAAINQNLQHDHVHLSLYRFDSKLSLKKRKYLFITALLIFRLGVLSNKQFIKRRIIADHCKLSIKVALTLLRHAFNPVY